MKREIKFRAWDGANMILFDQFSLSNTGGFWGGDREVWKIESVYEKGTTDPFHDGSFVGGYWHSDFANEIKLDSVELMQFTGLLDKNGKEIYEGDLIKIHAGHEVMKRLYYVVVYDIGSFHLEALNKSKVVGKTAFVEYAIQLMENIDDFYSHDQLPQYLEVIGNIHQNGNLL